MTPHSEVQRLALSDATIEYADNGGPGRPLLLVHAGVFADWFLPLAALPELAERRVVRIRRAGYTSGPDPAGHLTLSDHADHCAALLRSLEIETADVVGHSSGALICLDFATRYPVLVSHLVLYEPAPGGGLAGPDDAAVAERVVGPAIGAARAGDIAAAFDIFMRFICAPDYRAVIETSLGPDGLEGAERESAYFFSDEAPAVLDWKFGVDDASRVDVPVTVATGGASPPPVHGLADRVAAWLPQCKRVIIEGADHLLPLRNPGAFARLIADDEGSIPSSTR